MWVYMGPPESVPELPKLEWARVPETHRYVSKRFQETNYLQAVEGGIDSSHSNSLHATVEAFRMTDSYVESVRNTSRMSAGRSPTSTVFFVTWALTICAVRANTSSDIWSYPVR